MGWFTGEALNVNNGSWQQEPHSSAHEHSLVDYEIIQIHIWKPKTAKIANSNLSSTLTTRYFMVGCKSPFRHFVRCVVGSAALRIVTSDGCFVFEMLSTTRWCFHCSLPKVETKYFLKNNGIRMRGVLLTTDGIMIFRETFSNSFSNFTKKSQCIRSTSNR